MIYFENGNDNKFRIINKKNNARFDKKSALIVISTLICVFSFLFVFNINTVYASENVDYNINQKLSDDAKEEYKQNALSIISKCKEELKSELNKMDKKISSVKGKQEYNDYPAIRLNMDTPIFGLSSVCNQKLKIKSQVSTVDIASGYSIKDIVKNNSLKVPSFSVGNIVVITRDIKFDDNITLNDANTCILKLVEYVNQTRDVNAFLDSQITKVYKEYITEERANQISTLNDTLTSIDNKLVNIEKDITKQYLASIIQEEYQSMVDECNSYALDIHNLNTKLSNVLLNDEELKETNSNVKSLDKKVDSLNEKIEKYNANLSESIDLEKMYTKVLSELYNRKNSAKEYIDNSKILTQIEVIDANDNAESNDNNDNNDNENENKSNEQENNISNEETIKYVTANINDIDKLEECISKVEDSVISNLGKTSLNNIKISINVTSQDKLKPEEVANKEEVTDVVLKKLTKEDKLKILEEMYDIQLDYYKTLSSFYTSNEKELISDTKRKITMLGSFGKYSDESFVIDLFLNMEKSLNNSGKIYNQETVLSHKKNINIANEKITNLLPINTNVTKEYNEKIKINSDEER